VVEESPSSCRSRRHGCHRDGLGDAGTC
jgi:hypothetical protein